MPSNDLVVGDVITGWGGPGDPWTDGVNHVITRRDGQRVYVVITGAEVFLCNDNDGFVYEIARDAGGVIQGYARDLQVGDELLEWGDNLGWSKIGKIITSVAPGSYRWDSGPMNKGSQLGCDDTMVRYRRTTSTAVSGSRWNGKCPRCRKGTYTGFTAVEHEGGGCV